MADKPLNVLVHFIKIEIDFQLFEYGTAFGQAISRDLATLVKKNTLSTPSGLGKALHTPKTFMAS